MKKLQITVDNPDAVDEILRILEPYSIDPPISTPEEKLTDADWLEIRAAAWAEPRTEYERAFRDWMNCPTVLEIIPLGKYNGRRFAEIPSDYLAWILSSESLRRNDSRFIKDILHTASHHLKLRNIAATAKKIAS
jgi:hypothetical protein